MAETAKISPYYDTLPPEVISDELAQLSQNWVL